MKSFLVLAAAAVVLVPQTVQAQDAAVFNLRTASSHVESANTVKTGVKSIDAREYERQMFGNKRGPVLTSLYGSLIALNALDIVTTRKMMAKGGTELNPLMKGAAGSTHLMLGLKLTTTAATILIMDRVGKRNHRAAVIAATAANLLMSAIVANNMKQLR